jgi:predicted ATPase
MQPALEFAQQIIEVAERQDDPTYRLVAYRMLATNQYYAGHNDRALESLLRARQYRDPTRQRALSHRFGWDPSIAVLAFEVLVRLSRGFLDGAADISEHVQAEIATHTHATTIASARFCAVTWPKAVLRDLPALEQGSADLLAYCTEKRVEQIRLLAALHHAYARAMRAPGQDNVSAFRTAIDRMRSAGGFTGSSMILSQLAEAAMQAGDLKRAEADLVEGFAFVEQSGERYYLADLHRLGGRLALRQEQPDRSRAEACFVRAIDVARGQHGRLLELRAANDLARLWREGKSNNDVRALIEPILAVIEGGETAPDVREARDLLAALA